MGERDNSVRGRVIKKWKKNGKPDWSMERTLIGCIKTDSEFEEDRIQTAPQFRKHRKYLVNWVQGCHFPWLNPRWNGGPTDKTNWRENRCPRRLANKIDNNKKESDKGWVFMRYAGLTDEPARRKREHGNPSDFRVIQQFTSEPSARQWERRMLAKGYEEDTSGKGWKYGYTFSIRR